MNNAAAWAAAMALACGLALASVGRRAERAMLALGALGAAAHLVATLERWSGWEATVRHDVYGVARGVGLALDRALEASLMCSVCALIAGLHRAGAVGESPEGMRSRRLILAGGALWGLYATAGFAWISRVT